jgi:poly(3-hydroxybutyrate) depolymerase
VIRIPIRVSIASALVAGCVAAGGAQSPLDDAFARFWSAPGPAEAAAAAAAVVSSGVSFDEAYARLKEGRTYASDVPRGVVRLSRRTAAAEFPYVLDVPASYDPGRRYQVRIQLHGGVSRPDPSPRGTNGIGALAGAEQIYVLPTAWGEAPWWSAAQVENLRAILDAMKRTYNVDENAVVLAGVSDGGTGAFYVAMRDTTPYASVLPLNGFLMVLANRSLALREELYPNNLRNKPFFAVNGALDQLYPAERVEPFVRHLQQGGVDFTWDARADGAHNTSWWPDVRDRLEAFVREHRRDPLPATLTWETDATPLTSRAHWLVIDALAPPGPQTPLPDLNDRPAGMERNFGVRSSGTRVTAVTAGSSAQVFGLLPGDVVLRIDRREIPSGVNLLDLLSLQEPGTPLTLVVDRGGKTIELSGRYDPSMTARVVPLFARSGKAGRVDLVRKGNTVEATTRGVAAFTLLISPDAFDFTQPITVVADGRTVFEGRVKPDIATLLKWAARDNDRTMLFGAEVRVTLPSR